MKKLLLLIFLLALSACAAPDPNSPRSEFATDGQSRVLEVVVPPDWVSLQESNDSLSLSNSLEAMERYALGFPALEAGDMAGSVNSLLKILMPPELEESPEAVAEHILNTFSLNVETMIYNFGTMQTIEIAGQNAVQVEGLGVADREPDNPDDDFILELRLIVLDAGEGYGIFLFGAPLYELESYLADWQAVVGSFRFQALLEEVQS